jgi:hypothetical protein
MNNIKARITALEKKKSGNMGQLIITLADGSARSGDLLDALLYHIEAQAAELPKITGYVFQGGTTPGGIIWDQFYKELHRIRDGDRESMK